MSKHDLAKGKFRVEGAQEGAKTGFSVKIVAPNGATEYQQVDVSSGTFAFTAAEGGQHKACFYNMGEFVLSSMQVPCAAEEGHGVTG